MFSSSSARYLELLQTLVHMFTPDHSHAPGKPAVRGGRIQRFICDLFGLKNSPFHEK